MFKEFNDFNTLDFLNLAEELLEHSTSFESSTSAVKRNIYGRIYYAIFLYVREWLKNNTQYTSFPFGEHQRMPNFIKKHGPFNEALNVEIYDSIVNLKKLRHQSDYYLEIPNKYSQMYDNWVFFDINKALQLANFIIKSFNEYNN